GAAVVERGRAIVPELERRRLEALGAVEVDENGVEPTLARADEAGGVLEHHRPVDAEVTLGELHHGRVALDDGEMAFGEPGGEEARHRAAAEAEQQDRTRPAQGSNRERHHLLVVEDKLLRSGKAHRRLLRYQPVRADRDEAAPYIRAARHVQDRE